VFQPAGARENGDIDVIVTFFPGSMAQPLVN
jgi:hypothetical protein